MNKKKSIIALIITLLIIPTISSLVNIQDDTETTSSLDKNQDALQIDLKKPKTAAYQTYYELWIDDSDKCGNGTWAEVAGNPSNPWCTDVYGDGSLYLLEDITLTNPDGDDSPLIIGNTTLTNFIIQNCSFSNADNNDEFDAGISLYNSSNGQILDCDISNNQGRGIILDTQCKNNVIKNNTLNSNTNYGIIIKSGCDNNYIINNTIYDFEYHGIRSDSANNIVIENNTIYGNTKGDEGIYLSSSHNANIKNNTILDCKDGYPTPTAHGIYLNWADDANITINTIKDCDNGIYLNFADNKILSGNKMENCGILLYGNDENILKSGAIYTNNTANGKPIYFYADQNGLDTNNFTSEGASGQIILVNCDYSTISNFNISYTSAAIQLCYSEHNTISSNVGRNNYRGIIL